jgi:hypothetical protein
MNKKINTQLLIKSGNLESWNNKNPLLSAREVCLVEVPLQNGTSTFLMKIGNGINNFQDLPFLSALSADIYDWARAETKPDYDISEIKNFQDYADRIVVLENKIKELEQQLENMLVMSNEIVIDDDTYLSVDDTDVLIYREE